MRLPLYVTGSFIGYWRHSGLWRLITWGVIGVALFDGSGYAYAGNRLSGGPIYEVLRHYPGGMRLHGIILIGLAAWLIHGVTVGGRQAWLALCAFTGYGVWVSSAVVAAWWLNGFVAWGSPSKWIFLSYVTASLAARTPSPRSLVEPSSP